MVLVIPDDWHNEIDNIVARFSSTAKIVVLGCKGSGKSTFVRTLSDAYVRSSKCSRSAIILDTDCGQPDKTPPGTLSMYRKERDLSGKVLHRVVSQRFLGFVNPASNPFAYTEKVAEIFEDYSKNSIAYSGVPLIVNCHGWGTGCGRETWEAIVSIIAPDLVVYVGPGEFGNSPSNAFLMNLGIVPLAAMPPVISVTKVIVVDQEEEDSSDKRWVKIARHFRPDLTVFLAQNPQDFFKVPFVRKQILHDCEIEFVGIDSAPPPRDAICKTIVGIVDSVSLMCISLGFIHSVSPLVLFVPPHIPSLDNLALTLVRSRELNWSPRDSVSFQGKRTLVNFSSEPQPFFLPHVLGGPGAKVVSGRTNLKRHRHINS